ncbi:MAG: hypothetical protein NWE91_01935 [Candidatus Bathyarchaeota archaeon]|nr:hypothetical protein [Candidatus Bathyarchaeota archaeon]
MPLTYEPLIEDMEFQKSHTKHLGVPEWRVLLALAHGGPRNMYQIAKTYNFKYPVVHRATKNLHEIRWIKIVRRRLSSKNVFATIYSLKSEGLLWLLSRIPRTLHPSLVDFSEPDSLGLRKRIDEQKTCVLANLATQDDVYLHLLFNFDLDKIAKSNSGLFPLVFGNWDLFKEIGVTQCLGCEFPKAAFSTLVEYYYDYGGLKSKLGTIEMLFTYKLFYAFLEIFAEGYVDSPAEFREESVQKVATAFKSTPQLRKLYEQICSDIENKLSQSQIFIRRVRASMNHH